MLKSPLASRMIATGIILTTLLSLSPTVRTATVIMSVPSFEQLSYEIDSLEPNSAKPQAVFRDLPIGLHLFQLEERKDQLEAQFGTNAQLLVISIEQVLDSSYLHFSGRLSATHAELKQQDQHYYDEVALVTEMLNELLQQSPSESSEMYL